MSKPFLDIDSDTREAPLRAVVEAALPKWHDLTGVLPEQTRFTLGDMDVRSMNEAVSKALDLDEDGLTSCVLLECFLRSYLEDKSFTVADIMKDYAALQDYLARARELFTLLQADEVAEHFAAFRGRVKDGLRQYEADSPDTVGLVDDPDALPFLRRDALYSMEALTPYQFLAGEFGDDRRPKVVPHVYQAWSINDLLPAVRDMSVSGVAVVLVRDPAHTDRSFFGFCMKNGDNVVFFTDRERPAFPGQEDVMRSRGRARQFAKRAWSNHFPYQILKPEFDDRGDVYFNPETAPVIHGPNLVPLMPIAALEPQQVVWLTMVLSLLSDRFWLHRWQAPELAYTGEMVVDDKVLVEHEGRQLPAARGYQPLGLKAVEFEDVSREAMAEQLPERPRRRAKRNESRLRHSDPFRVVEGVNQWLEDRYARTVDPEILNQWAEDDDVMKLLPAVETEGRDRRAGPATREVATRSTILSKRRLNEMAFWEKPKGYTLKTFSNSMFGTRDELKKDRAFIGRHNLAMHIQREADREYEARRDEINEWYAARVEANAPALARQAALQRLRGDGEYDGRNCLTSASLTLVRDKDSVDYLTFAGVNLGSYREGRGRECFLAGTRATWKCLFTPRTADDLALLAGVGSVEKLPDVLRHWQRDKDYVGNSILNRIDPVEAHVHDPWMQANFRVALFLSKRSLNRLAKSPDLVTRTRS